MRYYRNDDSGKYMVASTTPDEGGRVPYGEMTTYTSSQRYIQHWANPDEELPKYWKRMSRDTGLSPQYLNHITKMAGETGDKALSGAFEAAEVARSNKTPIGTAANLTPQQRRQQWKESMATIKSHPLANPETLFTDIPSATVIGGAFVDQSIRHTFPTMVALAQQDKPGKEIVPSTNLSKYSAAVATNAARKGLLGGPQKEYKQVNPIGQTQFKANPQELERYLAQQGFQEIPDTEVSSARQSLREKLRGPKTSVPHVSPAQFEHLKLFEN